MTAVLTLAACLLAAPIGVAAMLGFCWTLDKLMGATGVFRALDWCSERLS